MPEVIGIGIGVNFQNEGGGVAPPPVAGKIQLEASSSFITLEDGSGVILLEG